MADSTPPQSLRYTLEELSRLSQKVADSRVDSTASTIPQRTTQPDEVLFHKITDAELEQLSETRRESLIEAIWGCVGVALGSLVPVLQDIRAAYWVNETNTIPMDGIGFFQALICFGAVVLGGGFIVVAWRRGKRKVDLVDTIRKRKKVA